MEKYKNGEINVKLSIVQRRTVYFENDTSHLSCSELSPLAISPIHVCSVNKPENL